MSPQCIVIVGGGQAGAWATKTLRDEGYAGALVLIGDEQHPPYERPPLSKAVLAGEAAPETTHIFKDALFESLAIDWRRGRRAVAIERDARRVRLDDDEQVDYDRLLLCMGGRARPLSGDIANEVPVHLLRSVDDAVVLRGRLARGCRLLVIGGGWIGLEVAATARRIGAEVHVVETLGRPCARVLPGLVSDRLLQLHSEHGVTFSLGATLQRLEKGRAVSVRAVLGGGECVDADVVLAGLGMIANDELARDAAIPCRNGIIVDGRCATSDPHVFAAGDVAIAPNRWSPDLVRLETWQNAQDQGIAAAKAMLGNDIRYDPVPRFWSDQYDVNVQIAGIPGPASAIVMRDYDNATHFIVFALDDGHVRAAIGFNAGRDMRRARKLVETAALVDPNRLADTTIDLGRV